MRAGLRSLQIGCPGADERALALLDRFYAVSGFSTSGLSSYAALDLRNNLLPQFGQALSVEAAVFSSCVASHLEHT
jgi:hypothetical protein